MTTSGHHQHCAVGDVSVALDAALFASAFDAPDAAVVGAVLTAVVEGGAVVLTADVVAAGAPLLGSAVLGAAVVVGGGVSVVVRDSVVVRGSDAVAVPQASFRMLMPEVEGLDSEKNFGVNLQAVRLLSLHAAASDTVAVGHAPGAWTSRIVATLPADTAPAKDTACWIASSTHARTSIETLLSAENATPSVGRFVTLVLVTAMTAWAVGPVMLIPVTAADIVVRATVMEAPTALTAVMPADAAHNVESDTAKTPAVKFAT
jgi:hypothetical protein